MSQTTQIVANTAPKTPSLNAQMHSGRLFDECRKFFDYDGQLGPLLAEIWPLIEHRVVDLQRAFWARFSSADHIGKTHDEALLKRLAERDRTYTEGKYNRPIDTAWMERIATRGRFAAQAENPTYAIIGGLNGSYEEICSLLFEHFADDPHKLQKLVKALYRLAAFEAELMLAAVTAEHEAQAAAKLYEQGERFRAEIAEAVAKTMHAARLVEDRVATAVDDARSMHARATEIAQASQQGAFAAEQALQTATEMVVSMQRTLQQAEQAVETTNQATARVTLVEEAAFALAENTRSVASILDTIRGIATKTNLLALNATIEAARAGEAGRAFAVVAGEVKSLSGAARRATDDVGEHVSAIDRTSQHAARSSAAIQEAIQGLQQSSNEVSTAMRAQTESVAIMNTAFEETAHVTSSISAAADQVRSTSGRVAGEMEALRTSFSHMSGELARLEQNVTQFLDTIDSRQ